MNEWTGLNLNIKSDWISKVSSKFRSNGSFFAAVKKFMTGATKFRLKIELLGIT